VRDILYEKFQSSIEDIVDEIVNALEDSIVDDEDEGHSDD
jgi:hypothetical protein